MTKKKDFISEITKKRTAKNPEFPKMVEVAKMRSAFAKALREIADGIESGKAIVFPVASTAGLVRAEAVSVLAGGGEMAVEWYPDTKAYWENRNAALDALGDAENALRKARDEAKKYGVVR